VRQDHIPKHFRGVLHLDTCPAGLHQRPTIGKAFCREIGQECTASGSTREPEDLWEPVRSWNRLKSSRGECFASASLEETEGSFEGTTASTRLLTEEGVPVVAEAAVTPCFDRGPSLRLLAVDVLHDVHREPRGDGGGSAAHLDPDVDRLQDLLERGAVLGGPPDVPRLRRRGSLVRS